MLSTRLRTLILTTPLPILLCGSAGIPAARSGELHQIVPAGGFPVIWNDCNGNGIEDAVDIAFGTSGDRNGNGVPDECEELGVRPPGPVGR